MGLFSRKPKVVKEIYAGTWGHLVQEHNIDVDTLSKDIRCVEKPGSINGSMPVTLLRVFSLSEVRKKGIDITGWETFDHYPELILFEGYYHMPSNKAHLVRKKA